MKLQDQRKRKRMMQITILALLLIAVCISFPKITERTISYAVTMYGEGEHLYIVDRQEDKMTIYQANKKGVYRSSIIVPTSEDECVVSIPTIIEGDDNAAYILMARTYIGSSGMERDYIYKCDFKQKKLIEVADLSEFMEADSVSIRLIKVKNEESIIAVTQTDRLSCYAISKKGEKKLLGTLHDYGDYGSQNCAYMDTDQFVGINMWGKIAYISKDGTEKKLDVSESELTHFSSDGKNTIYMTSLSEDCLYSYNFETNQYEASDGYMEKFGQGIYRYDDVFKLQYEDADTYTVIVDSNGGGAVACAMDKDTITEYKILKFYYASVWWIYVILVFMICLAYAILLLLYELVFAKTHMIHSLSFKMAVIIILTFGMMISGIMYLITKEMESSYIEEQYTALSAITGVMRGVIEDSFGKEDKELEMQDMFQKSESYGAVYKLGDEEEIWKSYNFDEYRWLHTVDEDGTIRTLYTTSAAVGTPIQYSYHKDTVELMRDAVEDGMIRSTEYRDEMDTWLMLIVPITQGDRVVAILEVGTSKTEVSIPISKLMHKINLLALLIAIIITIVLIIILHRFLAPLRKLKLGVIEIIHGNTDVQLKIKGKDEVAQISSAFNQMAVSISENLNGMKRLTESYCRFVPLKFIELLQREKITDVNLGDQKDVELVLIKVHYMNYKEREKAMSVKGILEETNAALAVMGPIVTKYQGVVDTFEEGGLTAVFERKYLNAVNCALELQRAINGSDNHYAITVTSGIVQLGVIGDETRQSIMTIADQMKLNDYLQEMIPKYYSNILISQSVLTKLPNAQRDYKFRLLGDFFFTIGNKEIAIYDFYQNDSSQRVFLKDEGKEIFEKGVSLYRKKEFFEARQLFIEVLRMNRQDAAAKEYLCKCDMFYKEDNFQEVKPVLEVI